VIQSILFFALGFLCACLLALLVAPAIWRRAVRLTRKRIEATVPLTLTEIQADKDRLRAEFAVSTRRLEISLKELRERAAEQIVEIGRNREELKRLSAGRDETSQALSELEARGGDLKSELRRRETELVQMSARLSDADGLLKERAAELGRLNRLYEEASLSSVDSRAEVLARVGEIEKLVGDVDMLRGERLEAERQVRSLEGELRAAREAARAEKRKTVDVETRAERMLATMADREDAVGRHERELADLRERFFFNDTATTEIYTRLTKALEERLQLEGQVAELTLRLSKLTAAAEGSEPEPGKPATERRLDERLVAMTRENQKLRADLSARPRGGPGAHGDDAKLREQMSKLAAEVIALTSRLDGPDSPILAALDAPPKEGDKPSGALSLADRVRALQAEGSASS
jgi:chromosome segregation ATPase